MLCAAFDHIAAGVSQVQLPDDTRALQEEVIRLNDVLESARELLGDYRRSLSAMHGIRARLSDLRNHVNVLRQAAHALSVGEASDTTRLRTLRKVKAELDAQEQEIYRINSLCESALHSPLRGVSHIDELLAARVYSPLVDVTWDAGGWHYLASVLRDREDFLLYGKRRATDQPRHVDLWWIRWHGHKAEVAEVFRKLLAQNGCPQSALKWAQRRISEWTSEQG